MTVRAHFCEIDGRVLWVRCLGRSWGRFVKRCWCAVIGLFVRCVNAGVFFVTVNPVYIYMYILFVFTDCTKVDPVPATRHTQDF